ncbi:MAG: peptidase S41, partial [Schaalia georgiae]|nr:peptidase S41 [Schaalia georgiae]
MTDEKPPDEELPKKRRRSARAIGAGVIVAVLVIAGAIGWALHVYGPSFGIWFPPPSARDYGRTALG